MYIFKILLNLLNIFAIIQDGHLCRTPNDIPGQCEIIYKCKQLFEILLNRPMSNRNIEFLKRSQCGFEGKLPKVCCPFGDHSVTITEYPKRNQNNPTTEYPRRTTDYQNVPATQYSRKPTNYQTAPTTEYSRNPTYQTTSTTEYSRNPTYQTTTTEFSRKQQPTTDTPNDLVTEYPKLVTLAHVALSAPTLTPLLNQVNLLPNRTICGIPGFQDRILGGPVAALDEFPWSALIEYQLDVAPNKGFHCGGVLINERYVLTAAHCVKGRDLPKIISVRLGDHNTNTELDCEDEWNPICAPPAVTVPVEQQIVHEKYNPQDANRYHDIALLRLAKKIEYSEFIRPMCVPSEDIDLYANKYLIAVGWGKAQAKSESNLKRKERLMIKSDEECPRPFRKGSSLHEYHICAVSAQARNLCVDDDGGALLELNLSSSAKLNYFAAGIYSYGPPTCKETEKLPRIYTRVDKYYDWITRNLRP